MSFDETARRFLGTSTPTEHAGQQADLEKRQQRLAGQASKDAEIKAATFTEEILRWLQARQRDLELTPEQLIFAVSLATINMRENVPPERGGKEFFNEWAYRAREYYDANSK